MWRAAGELVKAIDVLGEKHEALHPVLDVDEGVVSGVGLGVMRLTSHPGEGSPGEVGIGTQRLTRDIEHQDAPSIERVQHVQRWVCIAAQGVSPSTGVNYG